MKKQAYMKPTMQVVKIQQQHMICTSPASQSSVQMRRGTTINDEEDVW